MEVHMLLLLSLCLAAAHAVFAQSDSTLLGTAPPSPSPSVTSSPSPAPPTLYQMTEEAFNSTRRRLTSISGAVHQLHIPDEEVYGTVLVFSDLLESPSQLTETAGYLYRLKFNVVVLPLAGFVENVLPSTKLRNGTETRTVRQALIDAIIATEAAKTRATQLHNARSEKERMVVAKTIQEEAVPLLRARLEEQEKGAPDVLEGALAVLNCLDPAGNKMDEMAKEQALHRYFETDHESYSARAVLQMAAVASLPGPILAVGVGYGSVAALAVARTGAVSRVVLLAPRLGYERQQQRIDHVHFSDIVSSIGGGVVPSDDHEVPAYSWVSVNLAARRELSNRHAQEARNAEVLAIVAQDDHAIDVQICDEYVQGWLGGKVVHYDAEHGIGKDITLEDENPFASAMMFGVAQFLGGIPFNEAAFKPTMNGA